MACAAVGHVKFKETLAKSAQYVDVSGIFWRTEGVLVCTPLLPCGTIWRIWKSVTGIWSRGLFSARFRSVPSSTIVLSLDDEAAAGLCVHSPDSVPHVDYTV